MQDQENIKVEERRGSMTKVAIVTLTDTESRDGLGRVVNTLSVAKEFKEEGYEVSIVLNGAGTRWVG